MSGDEREPSTSSPEDAEENITETIAEAAGGAASGLDNAAQGLDEGEAQAATETAADVASAVSNVARAAEAGRDLAEAADAGSEARVATAVGNLTGGVLGTAGAALDGLAGTVPEEARGALSTAANVTHGVAGAARATEQVVQTIEQVSRAVGGPGLRFQTRAELGAALFAEAARGRQTLSGLYEFVIRVEHREEGGLGDDGLDALLSRAARLGLTRDTLGAGEVYGVLSRVAMRPMTGPRPTRYDLTLVPKLWRLTLTRRSRVYQDMSHLEVVIEVLRQHGLDVGTQVFNHTEESYPTHEYVVQHDETDFAFVSRLLAHNGIHFHFVQDPGTEVVVLGDRNAAFEPVVEHRTLRYHPYDFAADDGDPRVWDLQRERQPRPREVVLRDFNWRTPHHPLRAQHAADERSGYGFVDLYGQHFRDDAQGAWLAQVRAEEQRVLTETFTGKTSLRGVQPGTWFELEEHPNPDLNQRYLVTSTQENMDDGHTYVNEFCAIPFSVTYRPPRTFPWPRIEGLTNALVDGDTHNRSPAAPIDDAGRYRVMLPFDEAGTEGGQASRWVRRAQPSAGAGYGMHFPLHIGTEVAVAHMNGDPDRPVIVGAVPNVSTSSPVVSGNAPQSRIQTGSGLVMELDDDC
jgi:type VI secretion system secreted protein VgrG